MRFSKYLGLDTYYDRARLRMLESRIVRHRHDLEGYRSVLSNFNPHGVKKIRLNQIWLEWKNLMQFLLNENPGRILEIGTERAGSTYFLTRLFGKDGQVITVDSNPTAGRYIQLINRKSHNLVSVKGNSQDAKTVSAVADILQGQAVDLLYIDGDHSYEGVRKDFELYSPFCADRSLIVFHDIIPDYQTSRNIPTASNTGGVYKLWAELRTDFEHREFVDSPGQDGYGIGVLFYRTHVAKEVNAKKSSPAFNLAVTEVGQSQPRQLL